MSFAGKLLSLGLDLTDVKSRFMQAVQFGVDGAWNSALVLGGGTASSPITTASANKNFVEFRTKNTATSGDNRGVYNRFYIAGAGAGGESLRTFTSVVDVAAGTAHGAHISLGFAASGSITGLGVAGRNTLHVPDAAMAAGGTYAAVQSEIWSDGASSDPSAVTQLSFIRVVNDGNATGVGLVDDKAYLLSIQGGSIGAGNMVYASAAADSTHKIRVLVGSTVLYLMATSVA